MNKSTCSFVYILLLTLFLFSGCHKKPLDYRNGYLGDWLFDVEISSLNIDSIGSYSFSEETYLGTIDYGVMDDEIEIQYTDANTITLSIDKEGQLYNFPSNYSGGEFNPESQLHLFLRWGGLGGNVTHVIDGVKQ